ncbi:Hsp70 family protein, partial [Rhodopirellula sp.]|nr:Hsp70 family protein [Rhodopirellula sp.]
MPSKKLDLILGDARKLPSTPVRVLGIDLGTTNSTVSEIKWDPASPERIAARCLDLQQETLQGNYSHVLVPSIVALHGETMLVGEGAKRLRGHGLRKDAGIFYECKNDIGLQKTYHRAPDGFRSAAEISGHVLSFLREAAMIDCDQAVDQLVVTVPASFNANQRRETIRAANLAEMDLTGGACLDEPVAAFIDQILTYHESILDDLSAPKHLLVFDFGGGTCDVAVLKLEKSPAKSLAASSLAVSRYHRLGGGDIDAAIVHDVLIPQLREQNSIDEHELDYVIKKNNLEPALLGVAEQLKVGLSDEIRRLQAFDAYEDSDKSKISKTAPGAHKVTLGQRQLLLTSPNLSAEVFEKLLEPFLDKDLLYAKETDYRITCSIFAPLNDALDRSGLSQTDVDYCLLVGGSTRIPQVTNHIQKHFKNATILQNEDRDAVKSCVSRGAAYHALSLALGGSGIIRSVCHDDIAIMTGDGAVNLIPRQSWLPYPDDGSYAVCNAIGMPKDVQEDDSTDVRVELLSGSEEHKLFTACWNIAGPAREGAPLAIQYRLDENQVLEIKLSRADGGDAEVLSAEIDKPLTNVVNPQSQRVEALEIEEELKVKKLPKHHKLDKMRTLASLYSDLGQGEKAISTLLAALKVNAAPDAGILNKLGILCGEQGDFERQEKFYLEATNITNWNGPLFNLALSKQQQGKIREAIDSLERALAMKREAPELVLRAMLAQDQGDD